MIFPSTATILLCAGAQKLGSTEVIDLFWSDRATITFIPRSSFDDTRGQNLVQSIALDKHDASSRPCESFYLAFGAAGALLGYLSESKDLVLLPGSVPVAFEVLFPREPFHCLITQLRLV